MDNIKVIVQLKLDLNGVQYEQMCGFGEDGA
jgi:hypothetical protein